MKLSIKYYGLLNFPATYIKKDFLDRVKKIPEYKDIRKEPNYLNIIDNYYDIYERLIEHQKLINSLNLKIKDLRKKGVHIIPSKNKGTELDAQKLFDLEDKFRNIETDFKIIEKRYKLADIKFGNIEDTIFKIDDENNPVKKEILYQNAIFLIKSYINY